MKIIIVLASLVISIALTQQPETLEVGNTYVFSGQPPVCDVPEEEEYEFVITEFFGERAYLYMDTTDTKITMRVDQLLMGVCSSELKARECLREYTTAQEVYLINNNIFTGDIAILTDDLREKEKDFFCTGVGVEVEILTPANSDSYHMTATYKGYTYEVTPELGIKKVE
ncbi:MAG: hypothetical protein AAF708_18210 [Deinococcota bacterium]